MEKHSYLAEGVILSRKNYGEADRILTIFTKTYGKIRVIAKGVRRTTSRKKGSVELFNHIRFFAAVGRKMDVVTEVETKEAFLGWRKDLTRVAVAYHLAEVVEKLTPDHQEHKEVFALLTSALDKLSKIGYWELYLYIQSFKKELLEELGFLERGARGPRDLDLYIEDLISGRLRTKKFLGKLGQII